MKFTTATGSVYEVRCRHACFVHDEVLCVHEIRRLNNDGRHTDRMARNGGDWVPMLDEPDVSIGMPAIIRWGTDVDALPGSPTGAGKFTITSPVQSIE